MLSCLLSYLLSHSLEIRFTEHTDLIYMQQTFTFTAQNTVFNKSFSNKKIVGKYLDNMWWTLRSDALDPECERKKEKKWERIRSSPCRGIMCILCKRLSMCGPVSQRKCRYIILDDEWIQLFHYFINFVVPISCTMILSFCYIKITFI